MNSPTAYTIHKLTDSEDVAPKFGFDAVQEARFPWRDLEAEETGLAYHRVKPGQRGLAHRHDNAEEIYVVVGGSGRVKLDDKVEEIGTLDAIRVAPAVARAFEGGPEGLELLAFGTHHDSDGEILSGDFWDA
jgi:mannose-6-phosphate isomerase-like protein (cupin superfamily)